MKSDIKICAERRIRDSRAGQEDGGIPPKTLAEVVSASILANHVFSAVLEIKCLALALLRRLGQRHRYVVSRGLGVFLSFRRLMKYQISSFFVLHGVEAQIRIHLKQQDLLARITGLRCEMGRRAQFRAVRNARGKPVVRNQEVHFRRGVIIDVACIAPTSREYCPVVEYLERPHIHPPPRANLFWLHRVIANFYPAFFFTLQISKKIARALSIG